MFYTDDGHPVSVVTGDQMREIDRIAVEEFGLTVLQMMEHAGRSLAEHALIMLGDAGGEVAVLAGSGGNGGGGLCCARHLRNRGVGVSVLLDRDPEALGQAARAQLTTLLASGLSPTTGSARAHVLERARLVIDALIGYGLRGAPRGQTAELIELCRRQPAYILSLDVPSGLDATTGTGAGTAIRADRILTLALPKTGLRATPGDLYLADLGIPPEVFMRVGVDYMPPFSGAFWIRLRTGAR